MNEDTIQVYKLAIESNERVFLEASKEKGDSPPTEELKDKMYDKYTEVLKHILDDIKGK